MFFDIIIPMNPVASVIMPCYNSEAHLAAALDSILSQSFADFELIAVDDGSTDSTHAILSDAAAKDGRIKIIAQENHGVSAARNRGLDAAQGTYVFFVDPDDAIHPEMLARGIDEMTKSQADVCFFAYRRRFGDEGEWMLMPLQGDYHLTEHTAILQELFPRLFGYSNQQARIWGRRGEWRAGREEGSVCRVIYRLDLIRRAQVRFDESIVLYEDAIFNSEYLLAANQVTCLNEPLYDYTVRPSGAVTENNRSLALFTNKLRLLSARRRLDELSDGKLFEYYCASCVFSVLEMIHALFTTKVPLREALAAIRAYLADDKVKAAFKTFPMPVRRPLAAILILALRLMITGK